MKHAADRPARPGSIEWPRAEPAKLRKFDPSSKKCVMNCGPHTDDPRTRAERMFLCDECLPVAKVGK